MIELKEVHAADFRHRSDRGIGKGISVSRLHRAGDFFGAEVREQRTEHTAGCARISAGERSRVDVKLGQLVGHKKTAVGGQTLKNGLAAGELLIEAAGAVIAHDAMNSCCFLRGAAASFSLQSAVFVLW